MQIKDVKGFETRYAVSDDGRVWSKYQKRWMHPWYNCSGYLKVGLTAEDGHREKRFVHRLVCEAFHGKPPSPEHQVDHINAVHTDNRAENLRWVSADENLVAAAERGIGRRRRPIVGFNEQGDVVRFHSITVARRSGFSEVRLSLRDPALPCHGYYFVYAEDWRDDLPRTFFSASS